MTESADETPRVSKEPFWILIVQVLGSCFICLSLIFFFLALEEISKGIWIDAIPGFAFAITGIMLLMKRKAGCMLFLGIYALCVILSLLSALGYGWFEPFFFETEYDWIFFGVLWILGVFLFIKNRRHFA